MEFIMPCQELKKLEDKRRMHREASLFLGDGAAMAPPRTIITHNLLIKTCRGDQARVSHSISIHRRDCVHCCIPHQ
jgi:hypothetical protein